MDEFKILKMNAALQGKILEKFYDHYDDDDDDWYQKLDYKNIKALIEGYKKF